uniref:Uncharacterized protein n=1 Tax=Takifugu rubripes TaxID=31033 RepID=A0A674PDX7_TAKRU
VFAIQPVGFICGDEELRAVGVGSRVGHGQFRVLQDKVFIVKLAAVDRLAPGAVVVGEVSTLAHKLRDDAMEAAALVAEAFLVCAQAAEVLYRLHGEGRGRIHHTHIIKANLFNIYKFHDFYSYIISAFLHYYTCTPMVRNI